MPIYMKYEGIQGEAKGKYTGWIELESCQFGGNRPQYPIGSGEKVEITPVEVVASKVSDGTSGRLMQEAMRANPVKVTIEFVEIGKNTPFLTYELENVMISSFSSSGSSSGAIKPRDNFSLNYTKISYTAIPKK